MGRTVRRAVEGRTLYVDRAQSGDVAFNAGFGAVHTATMEPLDGLIRLHILIDRASVEVFGNDGRVVFTEQIFPGGDSLGLELFLDGQQVTLNTLDIWQLEPATFRVADR